MRRSRDVYPLARLRLLILTGQAARIRVHAVVEYISTEALDHPGPRIEGSEGHEVPRRPVRLRSPGVASLSSGNALTTQGTKRSRLLEAQARMVKLIGLRLG